MGPGTTRGQEDSSRVRKLPRQGRTCEMGTGNVEDSG